MKKIVVLHGKEYGKDIIDYIMDNFKNIDVHLAISTISLEYNIDMGSDIDVLIIGDGVKVTEIHKNNSNLQNEYFVVGLRNFAQELAKQYGITINKICVLSTNLNYPYDIRICCEENEIVFFSKLDNNVLDYLLNFILF